MNVPSFYGPEADARADSGEPTDEQLEVLAITNGIHNVIAKYGLPRLLRWTRNVAALQGLDYDVAIWEQTQRVNENVDLVHSPTTRTHSQACDICGEPVVTTGTGNFFIRQRHEHCSKPAAKAEAGAL